MMRRVKDIVSRRGLTALYHALIHSHLMYGALLWGFSASLYLKPIETIQKKAIRIVHNSNFNAHTVPLFTKSNILPLPSLISSETSKFMFLHTRSSLPLNISQTLNTHQHSHTYSTRSNLPYRPPRAVSNSTAKSLISEGLRVWGSLPLETTNTSTFSAFKSHTY